MRAIDDLGEAGPRQLREESPANPTGSQYGT